MTAPAGSRIVYEGYSFPRDFPTNLHKNIVPGWHIFQATLNELS